MHDKRRTAWVFAIGLLLAPGCDDGDDGSDEAGDGDGDTTGDGDGDGDPTGDGDGEPATDDDNGDFADTDEEPTGCAVHEAEADCMAETGCAPVYGNALADDGNGGWCTTSPEEYIGCASTADLCPSLSKILCDDETYWRTTGCVPGNVEVCEAPGEVTGEC